MDGPQVKQAAGRAPWVLGWTVVALSTLATACWAFWGSIEAFHEGWWAPTLGGRLLQTMAYLGPMLILLIVSLLAVRWPKAGAVVYFLIGVLFSVFIFGQARDLISLEFVISWLPATGLLVGIGLCYWFARFANRRLMYWLVAGVPLLVAIACGTGGAWKVAHRIDDGDRSAQLIEGNGVTLIWAPAGPGWVTDAQHAADWDTATDICRHLDEDGLSVCDEPQDIWRLPTVEEAVASMARHGKNSGGVWDGDKEQAIYEVQPDKESPMWIPFSETIYWWTASEIDSEHVWMIVYDGKVWRKPKDRRMGYQGFRAVREP